MRRWLLLVSLVPCCAAAPVLERVVIVARHGVRAPTKPPAALDKYAAQPWPEWPVAPGELTPHGAAGARAMGAWLRTHYASAGLFPASGCLDAQQVQLWSDGKDHRTVQSGDAVLEGLSPGCGLRGTHGPDGQADPLFTAMESGACPMPAADSAIVAHAVAARLAALPADYAPALADLRDVLDPPAGRKPCSGDGGICFENGSNAVVSGEEGPKVKGPLATGASLGESLALEYGQGMQGGALGWGRLDLPKLTRIMELHNLYSGVTRRDPAIAGRNAAVLATRVLQAAAGQGDAARLTVFLGHDTNLDNLAGVFGLHWMLPGQPDDTPPDGELVFETWRENGTETVKLKLRYQTAAQLREAAALTAENPPGEVALTPPYCAASGCSLADLKRAAAAYIPAGCVPHG